MNYIDLTQIFTSDMPVYPGDPQPEINQYAFLEQDGYNDFRVNTTMHVGTHVDAPLHFIASGKKIADYPAEQFVGRGVIIDARGKKVIDTDLLSGMELRVGDIVLICTGYDKKYRTPKYYDANPTVSQDFAQSLVAAKAKMLGVDGPSPDQEPFPVHHILLSADILIAENLTNLESLIGIPEFEIIALPARYSTEAAPARIIARY